VVSVGSTLSVLLVSLHRSKVNTASLSVMISCGSLSTLTISFMNRLANCRASTSLEHGKNWLFLVSRLSTTSMVSYWSDFGRSVMKSIVIDFHAGSWASFGCRNP